MNVSENIKVKWSSDVVKWGTIGGELNLTYCNIKTFESHINNIKQSDIGGFKSSPMSPLSPRILRPWREALTSCASICFAWKSDVDTMEKFLQPFPLILRLFWAVKEFLQLFLIAVPAANNLRQDLWG